MRSSARYAKASADGARGGGFFSTNGAKHLSPGQQRLQLLAPDPTRDLTNPRFRSQSLHLP